MFDFNCNCNRKKKHLASKKVLQKILLSLSCSDNKLSCSNINFLMATEKKQSMTANHCKNSQIIIEITFMAFFIKAQTD